MSARCTRARLVVAAAAKGGASGSGASQPGVDDWISRWKDRKSTGKEAPPPRSAEEAMTGPDPRTAYRYVFAGGLSSEACAFSALILRDALEPRGVRLHTTQLTPLKGSPWTLRRAALALGRATRLLTRFPCFSSPAAAPCAPLRSRWRPCRATCRCG